MLLLLLKRIFKLLLKLCSEIEANVFNILTGSTFSSLRTVPVFGRSQSRRGPRIDEQIGWPGCLPHPFSVSRAKCNEACGPSEFFCFIYLLFIFDFISLITNTFTWFKFQRAQRINGKKSLSHPCTPAAQFFFWVLYTSLHRIYA